MDSKDCQRKHLDSAQCSLAQDVAWVAPGHSLEQRCVGKVFGTALAFGDNESRSLEAGLQAEEPADRSSWTLDPYEQIEIAADSVGFPVKIWCSNSLAASQPCPAC